MNAENSNPANYLSIRCTIPVELEDELPGLLSRWPVLGSEIAESAAGGVQATVYLLGSDVNAAEALEMALAESGATDIEQECVGSDDWLAMYRERVQPFPVGDRWWIDPHPDQPTHAPDGRSRLVIEPRMAFGTGSHESTRAILMCLESLEVTGRRVLDVGTGSGILALAADSLGADSVVAVDIDPVAVWVALQSARLQEWKPRVGFVVGSSECLGGVEFDIVLCNMVSSSFLPLASDLATHLAANGIVVFSGLLETEVDAVAGALSEVGLYVESTRMLGEWARVTATAGRP